MAKIYNINPYDDSISYLKGYDDSLYDCLKEISFNVPEKDYNIASKKNVSIEQYYYTIKDNKIENFYKVVIEKDRKEASIYTKLKTKNKKELLSLANMLLLVEGVENAFAFIDNDEEFINKLIDEGFMSLGEEKNRIVMLKEKVKENEDLKERSISWK